MVNRDIAGVAGLLLVIDAGPGPGGRVAVVADLDVVTVAFKDILALR